MQIHIQLVFMCPLQSYQLILYTSIHKIIIILLQSHIIILIILFSKEMIEMLMWTKTDALPSPHFLFRGLLLTENMSHCHIKNNYIHINIQAQQTLNLHLSLWSFQYFHLLVLKELIFVYNSLLSFMVPKSGIVKIRPTVSYTHL